MSLTDSLKYIQLSAPLPRLFHRLLSCVVKNRHCLSPTVIFNSPSAYLKQYRQTNKNKRALRSSWPSRYIVPNTIPSFFPRSNDAIVPSTVLLIHLRCLIIIWSFMFLCRLPIKYQNLRIHNAPASRPKNKNVVRAPLKLKAPLY